MRILSAMYDTAHGADAHFVRLVKLSLGAVDSRLADAGWPRLALHRLAPAWQGVLERPSIAGAADCVSTFSTFAMVATVYYMHFSTTLCPDSKAGVCTL